MNRSSNEEKREGEGEQTEKGREGKKGGQKVRNRKKKKREKREEKGGKGSAGKSIETGCSKVPNRYVQAPDTGTSTPWDSAVLYWPYLKQRSYFNFNFYTLQN